MPVCALSIFKIAVIAVVLVIALMGVSPSWAEESPSPRIAQAQPVPPSGANRATKDDIRWLWEQNEHRWGGLRDEISDVREEISNVRGEISGIRGEISGMRGEISDVRRELSDFKNTVIILLGGIIAVLLAQSFLPLPRHREKSPRNVVGAPESIRRS